MRILWILCFALIGCAAGPCRQDRSAAQKNQELPMTQVNPAERVRVYKPDGSLQCGMGQAIAVDVMKKELTGIQIFSSENKADGLMHIQVCGSPTGRHNVYEINRSDLEAVQKLGFKEWTWD